MTWEEQIKLRYGLSDGKLDWVKLVFLRVLKNAALKPCVSKSIEPKNVRSSEAIESLLEKFWVLGGVALAAKGDRLLNKIPFVQIDKPIRRK